MSYGEEQGGGRWTQIQKERQEAKVKLQEFKEDVTLVRWCGKSKIFELRFEPLFSFHLPILLILLNPTLFTLWIFLLSATLLEIWIPRQRARASYSFKESIWNLMGIPVLSVDGGACLGIALLSPRLSDLAPYLATHTHHNTEISMKTSWDNILLPRQSNYTPHGPRC